MDKVRLGIIGIGRIGSIHARIANDLKRAELVGYCDLIKERADNSAEKYGVKAFYDYKEMTNLVDAVIVSVQTEFHYEIAKYFIMHNKHVLVEKPITINLSDGSSLINLAKEHNVILSVGHVERFNSAVIALENITESEKIIGLSVKRMSPMDYRVKDIDVVLDLMIHDIDIVLNIMKPYKVKRVSAMKNILKKESKEKNHADYCNAQLLFDNDAVVDITASRVTDKKIRELSINEVDKFINVDYLNKQLIIFKNFESKISAASNKQTNTKYQEEAIVKRVFVNNTDAINGEQQNFVDSILNKDKIKVTGEDGLLALKIAKTIQEIIYN